jgi:hypothetical protein
MAGICGFAVVALLVMPPVAIAGFLIATPILAVGLTLVRWRELNRPLARATLVLFAVFALGVIGTQEGGGGGIQWGGRYLMLVIPLAVPAAIVATSRQLVRTPSCRTIMVAVVVLMSVGMSVNGLLVLNRQHELAVGFQTNVNALAEIVADGTAQHPTIVSRNTHLGRHMWREVERIDFLLPPLNEFTTYMERFAATGAVRFGFVGDIEAHEALFASIGFRVVTRIDAGYTVLERVETP